MSKEERNPYGDVQKFERALGMPQGWFLSLLKEDESDDWSFVIKLHALLEAAVAHVIIAKMELPEAQDFVARLNMQGQTSKTTLGKARRVLESKHVTFITALSTIRNECVHDVRNVDFMFAGYVEHLPG